MQKIRILFEKKDTAKYISHLDLVRIVTRAIKRAEIPIVYSNGFNPTPKLNFTLPLSLGQESVCEIMNFKVEPEMDTNEIKARLEKQLPDGIIIKEVYVPAENSDDFYYASYKITLDKSVDVSSVNDCFSRDSIVLVKRTKSGEKETDIKPFVIKLDAKSEDEHTIIECILNSKDPNFLNPEYIVKAYTEYIGKDIGDYSILRTEILTEKLKIYR